MAAPKTLRPLPVRAPAAAALLALAILTVRPEAHAQATGPTAPAADAAKVLALDPNGPAVAQTGRSADLVRDVLRQVKLPPGFRIELHALVPGARALAPTPGGTLLMVSTRSNRVWTVDRKGDAGPPEVRPFAPSLALQNPHGVCWSPEGALFVVETNRVLRFDGAAALAREPNVGLATIVPQGRLVPPEEQSGGHSARVCRVGPDRKLYIAIGQPYNVQPREKLALYERVGIGGIVRMNLDGSGREVYATGIRNSVGLDFHPRDGTLWFTDNQTDHMGDDIPLGEINRATKPGQFFGYPYIVSRTRVTQHGYDKDPLPAGAVDPQVMTDAHAADLGIAFYTGTQFPPAYRTGFFSAQHGSWNRSKPIGARVLYTSLKADGTADRTEIFAEGWLDDASGAYRGRPVDVAVAPDGSLYVSDDYVGAVYRISYAGAR